MPPRSKRGGVGIELVNLEHLTARVGAVPERSAGAVWSVDMFAAGAVRKHNASMPNVLIRDLPAEVHASLQRRAEAAGQSLQQYLTNELSRVAQSPTLADVLERIAQRSGGRVGFETAVDDLDDERAQR